MKFLAKINRNYLLPFVGVLLVVIVACYFILSLIIEYGAKENLLSKEYLIVQQIEKTGVIPNLNPLIDVQKVNTEIDLSQSFRKVNIWNEMERENEIYLEYSSNISIAGSWYIIKIRQSMFENQDLILILVCTFFFLISSVFLVSFFTTKRMNRTIWSGFEHNLSEIENYSLRLNKDISLEKSNIEEFERLNCVIMDFTDKLRSDYLMLKEFTENASHEIQTPLSIALINLEEILQYDIEEEIFKKVATVIGSLKRLTSLNRNLLLLTKIENMQFESFAEISLNEIIFRKNKDFSLLLEANSINLEIETEGDFIIRMNEYLGDILIGNLLANAIAHNIKGGVIKISIKQGFFGICNTGDSNTLSNKTIFNRFVSGDSNSPGLGLAIVKQICETHNLDINYINEDLHCFTIRTKF